MDGTVVVLGPLLHMCVCARDLIEMGLDQAGFVSVVPKTMTVWRTTERYLQEEEGVTHSASRFDVNVSIVDVKRRRLGRRVVDLAAVGFHEAVHAVRYEYHAGETLAELVAGEALAYVGESRFVNMIGFPNELVDVEEKVNKMPEELKQALFDDLVTEIADASGELEYEDYEFWLCQPLPGVGAPPGIIAGIYSLARQAPQGLSGVAELVAESPSVVLGIE